MRFPLSCLVVAVACASASAATPDPLAFVPKEATLVLKVEKPRQLIEAVTALDAYKGYENLPAVKAALESTTATRFFQLLKVAETKLGQKWPDMLDSLAGGGIAIGTVSTGENAPFVLVAQGTDEKKAGEAFKLLVELLSAELARQSPPGAEIKPEVGEVTLKD